MEALYPLCAHAASIALQKLILQCSNSIPTLVSRVARSHLRFVNAPHPARKARFLGAHAVAHAAACPDGRARRGGTAQAGQSCAARGRSARGFHLGRSRSTDRRRTPGDRGHLRHVGRCSECSDAGRRTQPRRPAGGPRPAGRFLACGQCRRPPHRPATQGGRTPASVRLERRSVVGRDVALAVALRSQPAQHQPAQGPDRAPGRLRGAPPATWPRPVHFGDRRAKRRSARLHPRGDHGGSRDGVGLSASPVPRRRDRRRTLLGRRLQRQSRGASVSAHDLHRGRADRADQSARAPQGTDESARDRQPDERDQLQRRAALRAARRRLRQSADR